MKFIKVTEHYGYCYERIANDNLYVIYNIKDGKPNNVVAGMKERKAAIKECKYLEKLNAKRLNLKKGKGNERIN